MALTIGQNYLPTELQFISLLGYLQTECKPPSIHKTKDYYYEKNTRDSNPKISNRIPQFRQNCSVEEFRLLINSCESELLRQHQTLAKTRLTDLDRHKLLR